MDNRDDKININATTILGTTALIASYYMLKYFVPDYYSMVKKGV